MRTWLAQHRRALTHAIRRLVGSPVSTLFGILVVGVTLALPAGGEELASQGANTYGPAHLMGTDDGKSVMQTLYGIDAMQIVQDSQYDQFRKIVKASELDLSELIK